MVEIYGRTEETLDDDPRAEDAIEAVGNVGTRFWGAPENAVPCADDEERLRKLHEENIESNMRLARRAVKVWIITVTMFFLWVANVCYRAWRQTKRHEATTTPPPRWRPTKRPPAPPARAPLSAPHPRRMEQLPVPTPAPAPASAPPPARQWPFLVATQLAACGLAADFLSLPTPIKPLGLLKSSKTGSSTVQSIGHRIMDAHGLRKMPLSGKGGSFLGYPGTFPGYHQAAPEHQYDAILNHAIFDRSKLANYLKPNPIFFTILREPSSRHISAFSYFTAHSLNWDEHLDQVVELDKVRGRIFAARFTNNLAYNLGWYEFVGDWTTRHDSNASLRLEFVNKLEREFDLVLMLDRIDEGLVLLGRLANLTVAELTYSPMLKKGHKAPFYKGHKVHPTKDQHKRLKDTLLVDSRAIYDHFTSKFDSRWAAAVAADPSLLDDLKNLQCLNRQLGEGPSHWRRHVPQGLLDR